jgi:hypothetical protein
MEAETDTQFTIFDLSGLKRQLDSLREVIFWDMIDLVLIANC